jgi:hypothetical protein
MDNALQSLQAPGAAELIFSGVKKTACQMAGGWTGLLLLLVMP